MQMFGACLPNQPQPTNNMRCVCVFAVCVSEKRTVSTVWCDRVGCNQIRIFGVLVAPRPKHIHKPQTQSLKRACETGSFNLRVSAYKHRERERWQRIGLWLRKGPFIWNLLKVNFCAAADLRAECNVNTLLFMHVDFNAPCRFKCCCACADALCRAQIITPTICVWKLNLVV